MLHVILSTLLVALSVDPPVVDIDCECFCVDGQETTLCRGLERATQEINLCQGHLACLMPNDGVFAPEFYDAPGEGAINCRSARVWRRDFDAHRIMRICDTMG